jgi:glycerate kinase
MELFDELTGLRRQIERSALVITGEGRLDEQSAEGKVVSYVTDLARRAGIPVIALCGSAAKQDLPLDAVVALTGSGMTTEDCIARPLEALERLSSRIAGVVRQQLDG